MQWWLAKQERRNAHRSERIGERASRRRRVRPDAEKLRVAAATDSEDEQDELDEDALAHESALKQRER